MGTRFPAKNLLPKNSFWFRMIKTDHRPPPHKRKRAGLSHKVHLIAKHDLVT